MLGPEPHNGHRPPDGVARLSPRELEVLEAAAEGLTNSEIAGRLEVTVHAVKFHLGSIYRKLGVANRTEAAVLSLRGGLNVPSERESAS